MSVPDAAIPTKISSVDEFVVGRKLRVAGQFLGYDEDNALILLLDGDQAILVDVSLCLGKQSKVWIQEPLGTIMVLGHLEESENPLPIPTLPTYSPAPVLDSRLVIRALTVVRAAELDMDAWNLGIDDRQNTI